MFEFSEFLRDAEQKNCVDWKKKGIDEVKLLEHVI